MMKILANTANGVLKLIFTVDDFFERIENFFLVFFLFIMVSMAFLQILLRNFFNTGISWGDVFLRHLVLWVGFIGACLAAKEGRHINIDVASKIFGPRSNHLIQVLVNAFSIFIAILLAHAALTFVGYEKADGIPLFTALSIKIPTWTMQVVMPAAFIILAYRFFVRIIESLAALWKGESE